MKNRKLLKKAAGIVAAAMIVNGIPWKMKGEKQFDNTCIVADAAHYITGSYYYKQLQQDMYIARGTTIEIGNPGYIAFTADGIQKTGVFVTDKAYYVSYMRADPYVVQLYSRGDGMLKSFNGTAPSGRSLEYNGSAQQLCSPGYVSDGEILYRLGDSGSFSSSIPTATAPGHYTIEWVANPSDKYKNYENGSGTIEAYIDRSFLSYPSAVLSQTSYNYDGQAKKPSVTVYEDYTHTKKLATSDYTVLYLNNVNAGEGYVEISPSSSGKYNFNRFYESFTINGTNISPSISVYDWDYGETPVTPVVSGNPGNGTVTFYYSSSENGSYSTKTPTNAGTYWVYAEISSSGKYNGAKTEKKSFTINKLDSSIISAPTAIEGLVYDGKAHALINFGKASGGAMVYSLDGRNYSLFYTPTGKNAGDYTVYYKVSGGTNYNDAEGGTVKVHISKQEITPSLSIEDWTYGSEPNEPILEGNLGNADVTYLYAVKGSDNFRAVMPVTAGEYTVKAIIPETANYLGGEATADFSITHSYGEPEWKWDGYSSASAVFTCADCHNVKTIEAEITQDITEATDVTNGSIVYTASVTFEGKNYTNTVTKKLPSLLYNDISDLRIMANPLSYAYDGEEHSVSVKIKDDNYTLKEGEDYILTGNTATEVGTYTLKAEGIGAYKGSIEIQWNISYLYSVNVEINGVKTTSFYETGSLARFYSEGQGRWIVNGVPRSLKNMLSITILEDTDIYWEAGDFGDEGLANIKLTPRLIDEDNYTVNVVATWAIPDHATVCAAGTYRYLIDFDAEKPAEIPDKEIIYENGTIKTSKLTSTNGTFQYDINMGPGTKDKILCLVTFITYELDGKEVTIISDVATSHYER